VIRGPRYPLSPARVRRSPAGQQRSYLPLSGETKDYPETTKMFSHFNPETVTLLTSVQRAAIEEWAAAEPDASPMLRALAETQMARAILEAASAGERDRAKLKQAALTEISFA
jgi:hypothetical protein